jgi:hypothetical protein
MNIKPSAWMKELPTEEWVERAVRTTTVKEVADDWEQAIPLYTDDDLRSAVLAEREACAKIADDEANDAMTAGEHNPKSNAAWNISLTAKRVADAIRARGGK